MTSDPRQDNKQRALIEKTRRFVEDKFILEGSGHDWWHIYRVWRTSIKIAAEENADLFIVELAALLHDIADWKFTGGDESAGPRQARAWLESLGVEREKIDHICQIISDLSYKGSGVSTKMNSIEGMIVQDADRLDAMGAIGIGRTFTYGGYKGRPMYDPAIPPVKHKTFEDYKKNKSPTINHFHEKLLLLKGRINTLTGKRFAEERHAFMEEFLKRFIAEWNGEA